MFLNGFKRILRTGGMKTTCPGKQCAACRLIRTDKPCQYTDHARSRRAQTERRLRPLARRRARTLRPSAVDMRLRKPCVFLPLIFVGVFSVFFMVSVFAFVFLWIVAIRSVIPGDNGVNYNTAPLEVKLQNAGHDPRRINRAALPRELQPERGAVENHIEFQMFFAIMSKIKF